MILKNKRKRAFSLVEISLALGITLVMLMASTQLIGVQNRILMEAKKLSFYAKDVPKITRAFNTAATRCKSMQITDDKLGIIFDLRTTTYGGKEKMEIRFNNGTFYCYPNTSGDKWAIARNIQSARFEQNADATISVFITNTDNVTSEIVVERM